MLIPSLLSLPFPSENRTKLFNLSTQLAAIFLALLSVWLLCNAPPKTIRNCKLKRWQAVCLGFGPCRGSLWILALEFVFPSQPGDGVLVLGDVGWASSREKQLGQAQGVSSEGEQLWSRKTIECSKGPWAKPLKIKVRTGKEGNSNGQSCSWGMQPFGWWGLVGLQGSHRDLQIPRGPAFSCALWELGCSQNLELVL